MLQKGKQEHYALGQWLKKRYCDILSPKYSEDEIKIRSTTYDRTIESALANLAGMYPPNGNEIWNNNLEWQPIPVRSWPAEFDTLIGEPMPSCPAYEEAMEAVMKSQKIKETLEDSKPLFDYLTKNTGQNVTTFIEALMISDNLFINNLYNHKLEQKKNSSFNTVLL